MATRTFYEREAESYATKTASLKPSGHLASFVSLLPRNARVLDAGCGAGRDLAAFARAGVEAFGLDRSLRLSTIARLGTGRPVVTGDLRAPPFDPATFDGVWAMASLLHLEPEEVVPTLRSLSRLLRPQGLLFASVKRGVGPARDADGRWFTLHDELSWTRNLEAAGLQVLEVVGEPPETGGTSTVSPGWLASLSRRP